MDVAPESKGSARITWGPGDLRAAAAWAAAERMPALSEDSIRELHRRMFGRLWPRAGEYRTRENDLGAYWTTIPSEVRRMIDDGRFWISHDAFPLDEAALRLHHRLIKVQAFPDGNARHARMWCDMLLLQHGRPPLSWRQSELSRDSRARRAYIDALRAADAGDYAPLIGLVL
jgi:Fic-DOC domain mobile mystery protein B